MSHSIVANYDVEYNSGFISNGKYDSGAVTIGYDYPVFKSIHVGIAYDAITTKDDYSIDGVSFLNFYLKYIFPINDNFSFWSLLGYHTPKKDLEDSNKGLSYGLGITLKSGIGIDYMRYNISKDDFNYLPGYDGYITTYSLSYNF